MIIGMFILMIVLQVLSLNEAFNFSCPSEAHWKLRAQVKCKPARSYTCLYDLTRKVNAYRDRCSKPRILAPGYKYVFQPNLNRATCSKTRYQPLIFDTDGNSDCSFLKSQCNNEGQITYENGNTTSDRTCLCNTNNGYTFVIDPKNLRYCIPSDEDCSCYLGSHRSNTTINPTDVIYCADINSTLVITEDAFNKSQTLPMHGFDNCKYNIVSPKDNYRRKAVLSIIILVASYIPVAFCICFLQRVIRQRIQIRGKTNVQNLKLIACTDTRITISWEFIKDIEAKAGFTVLYRQKDRESKTWEKTGCLKHVEFTLQDLKPETFYEIKMKSKNKNGKKQCTSILSKQTLKAAPKHFDVVECTARSVTVAWYNNDVDESLEYTIEYRQKNSNDWNGITLSSQDIVIKENGCHLYTLQEFLPGTWYEVKVCSVHNQVNSQYTKIKAKRTLKDAPKHFDVVECTARSVTVAWYNNDVDKSLEYTIEYRQINSDDWINISPSTQSIMVKENGRHLYTLQDLLSGTWYEVKVCSVHNQVKGQYTEIKAKRTLKVGGSKQERLEDTLAALLLSSAE